MAEEAIKPVMGALSSDIQTILASVSDYTLGVAVANRYEVIINPPPAFDTLLNTPEVKAHLATRCESITLSGKSLATYAYRLYGPARQIPYEQIYAGEMQATFLLDKNLFIKQQFEKWMNYACDNDTFKLEYYNNYAGNMIVKVLDRENIVQAVTRFSGVYPKMVGDLQMGYDKDNDLLKLDVTFAFRTHNIINDKTEIRNLV